MCLFGWVSRRPCAAGAHHVIYRDIRGVEWLIPELELVIDAILTPLCCSISGLRPTSI